MKNSRLATIDPSIFETILENSPTAIAVLNAVKNSSDEVIDFEYIFVNKAGEIFVDRVDLLGKCMLQTYPEHAHDGLFQLYLSVFESGNTETRDFFYTAPKNKWASITVAATLEGVTVSCIDISDKRSLERKLEEQASNQSDKLKKINQNLLKNIRLIEEGQRIAKLGSWEWDLRDGRVKWSEELFRILGCENLNQELKLDDFYQYVHPEDLSFVQEVASKAAKTKKAIPIEYRVLTPGGEVKHVYGTGGYEILDEEGTVIKLFGIIQDITERKKIKLALEESLKQEKELGELKSRFVSMASHEFRTPLSTILSSTSLLDKYHDHQFLDKRKKHINRIRSNVYNMRNILNDFLSLSKLEEGIISIDKEFFDIKLFHEELIELFQEETKQNQKLVYLHSGETTEVCMDQKLLKNSCINLISNAIKYSPEGKDITVKSIIVQKQLEIQVIDEGMGIPPSDQKLMFTRFFRAKNATNIQGTGLGLTIVKRYVDLMDGAISFVSKLNEGTTFSMIFPNALQD